MHQNFFIHSSVNGHLGCFRVLAIVNSASVNSGIHVSFSVLVSSGYMPKSDIAMKSKLVGNKVLQEAIEGLGKADQQIVS